jgi:uncharacterized radical SAM protein YgiQ
MYIPTTQDELKLLGWNQLDVVLVTGDSYVDSPYFGVAIIGKVLIESGFRVGIIAQPDISSGADITRLGEPRLFWGVTGGCVDSMVANYTASGKKRRADDFTPGGQNNRRPDRAVIVYANLIRKYFKPTVPIVLGGIEAGLRRVAHYDYWSNRIRRSILFDAKADILVYGMAEKTIILLASRLKDGLDYRDLNGICFISNERPPNHIELGSFESVAGDKRAFAEMFQIFYHHTDPQTAKGLAQRYETRFWVQNPPMPVLTVDELDAVYELPYEYAQHPYYERLGPVKVLDTIKFSLTTHRGCYGECNFCAISVHQGRTVQSRSETSLLKEAERFVQLPDFKGYIQDIGGPTANMYEMECDKKRRYGSCRDKRCLFPKICDHLQVKHEKQLNLIKKIREIAGVKRVFVRSGLRYDLIVHDQIFGALYLKEILSHHISGQLKIAPEHTVDTVLSLMGKPGSECLIRFKRLFDRLSATINKKQFLTYYLMAAHPGCTQEHMKALYAFAKKTFHTLPEQIQIFTPLPSTFSSLMYWTEMEPDTQQPIFVEKDLRQKEQQKRLMMKPRRSRFS